MRYGRSPLQGGVGVSWKPITQICFSELTTPKLPSTRTSEDAKGISIPLMRMATEGVVALHETSHWLSSWLKKAGGSKAVAIFSNRAFGSVVNAVPVSTIVNLS